MPVNNVKYFIPNICCKILILKKYIPNIYILSTHNYSNGIFDIVSLSIPYCKYLKQDCHLLELHPSKV